MDEVDDLEGKEGSERVVLKSTTRCIVVDQIEIEIVARGHEGRESSGVELTKGRSTCPSPSPLRAASASFLEDKRERERERERGNRRVPEGISRDVEK